MSDKIKVLVVDDSRIYRGLIEKAVTAEGDIDVIGSVRNGKKALEFLEEKKPDIITLDVEMDEMNGLETLEEIKKMLPPEAFNELGVIMVSSHTTKGATVTIDALELGAFDFVTKPAQKDAEASIKVLRETLTGLIHEFVETRSRGRKVRPARQPVLEKKVKHVKPAVKGKYDAMLIGVSTGGPKALAELIPQLTLNMTIPIFIVQHMPQNFTKALAESLDTKTDYNVVEAANEMKVEQGHAYIAPGGKHMMIGRGADSQPVIKINDQPPEENCKPSVNVLFRSAVPVYGGAVIAMILTGMGADGTRGLGPLKRAGAFVLVQDEKSSVVWGMPGSAVSSGYVDKIAPLDEIPLIVKKMVKV